MSVNFKNIIHSFLFLILCQSTNAQFKSQPILPTLTGDTLLTKLIEDYKPKKLLDYTQCRDTLYKIIYRQNDTVYCVYTHYCLYLPDNVDPSTYMYFNGSNDGINAEHTYPLSKGTENAPSESDMHHIFPSKVDVNAARGNNPFNEIKDNLTKNWYYKNQILHSIPTSAIDYYSEYTDKEFEPREDHKGNVARALFYIKTMYKVNTDAADPNFFNTMKDTLCKWHFLDPVDSLEWTRTWMIAKYQDGKPNPFVIDCSLAGRTYCNFIADQCTKVGVKEFLGAKDLNFVLFPNPSFDFLNIRFFNPGTNNYKFSIIDLMGKVLLTGNLNSQNSEIENYKIDVANLPSGIFIFGLSGFNTSKELNINKLFIKI